MGCLVIAICPNTEGEILPSTSGENEHRAVTASLVLSHRAPESSLRLNSSFSLKVHICSMVLRRGREGGGK